MGDTFHDYISLTLSISLINSFFIFSILKRLLFSLADTLNTFSLGFEVNKCLSFQKTVILNQILYQH